MQWNEVELVLVATMARMGVERRSLARRCDAGMLHRLRSGVYVETEDWDSCGARDRHLLAARALQAVSAEPVVFSHWTAAAAHGLPLLRSRLGPVHRTVPPGPVPTQPEVCGHALHLLEQDLVSVGGLLMTGPSRTVVDLAAVAPFDEAVALADAALHASMIDGRDGAGELQAAWDRHRHRRSPRKIESVLGFADPRSESPGESFSRVSMSAARLPEPVLQQPFLLPGHRLVRTDFFLRRERVIGEMDGAGKYFDATMNGGDPARRVFDEKLREDALRALGNGFVRWGWREARSPRLLAERFAAAGVHPERSGRRAS